LTLQNVLASSVPEIARLAPGLRRLYLTWSELNDDAIPSVAKLHNLTYLQTFGNHFTDEAVQALGALHDLQRLALEEESLTVAAFGFVRQLPKLERLGLQDVQITAAELGQLRAELPGVTVTL
jgi:hypothetical protein